MKSEQAEQLHPHAMNVDIGFVNNGTRKYALTNHGVDIHITVQRIGLPHILCNPGPMKSVKEDDSVTASSRNLTLSDCAEIKNNQRDSVNRRDRRFNIDIGGEENMSLKCAQVTQVLLSFVCAPFSVYKV